MLNFFNHSSHINTIRVFKANLKLIYTMGKRRAISDILGFILGFRLDFRKISFNPQVQITSNTISIQKIEML